MISNRKLFLAALLAALPASAMAGQYHAVASGAPGSTATLTVVYTGDGVTAETEVTLGFDNTHITISNPTSSNGAQCFATNPTTLRIVPPSGGATALPNGPTTYCSYDVQIAAGAPDGTVIPFTANSIECWNTGGTAETCTLTATSAVTVQTAPPDVVLGFAPASAVAFPGGTSGTSTTASIAVSVASGSIGTGTVSNCVVGGTNASAFSVTGGVPATVPPVGSIDLSVTLANAALAATLTCDVADAGTATTHTWNLTAPAGTPVPAPGYSSNPAPGAAINRTGTPGSSCNSSVVITNNGFAGAGSDLTYNCSVAGADFTIASGASGTVAVGSSATVSVAVACPADGTSVTDTLTCTSNDPAVSTATYALSANGQAFVAPTFVPASSLWSKLALFGIFAALGMLVLGLRRNH